jgi:hypothetical protein
MRDPLVLVAFAGIVTIVAYLVIERFIKPRYLIDMVLRPRATA